MDKCLMVFVYIDNDGVIVDTEPDILSSPATLGICLTKERYIRDGISRGHREFLSSVVPVDKLLPDGYDRFSTKKARENNLRLVDGFGIWFLADNNASLAVPRQPRQWWRGLRRCFLR